MKRVLLLWLVLSTGLTAACHAQPPVAAVAEQLYQRHILTAEGRDLLRKTAAEGRLQGLNTPELLSAAEAAPQQGPVAVLLFCAQAFTVEMLYRTNFPRTPADQRKQDELLATALKQFKTDTTAALNYVLSHGPAAARLEAAIPAEDKVAPTGWTIYPPLGLGGAMVAGHLIHESRSTLGKTRTRLARDLHALGLLSDAAYQQVQTELTRQQLLTEQAVCERGATLMLAEATLPARRVARRLLLDSLQLTGQLTAARRREAEAANPPQELLPPLALLGFTTYARVVPVRELPARPEQLYPALLAQVSQLWPRFRPTEVQATVVRREDGPNLWADYVTLSFRADGRRYASRFLHAYARKDGTQQANGPEVGEEFRTGINQWLRDQQAPERLYLAYQPDARSVYGQEQLDLAILTRPQRKVWGSAAYFLTEENHDNRFTSAWLDSLPDRLQALGLLSHLTPAQLTAARQELSQGQKQTMLELLACFPQLLYWPDWEMATEPAPYARYLREMAAISRGGFAPVQVQDTFRPEVSYGRKTAFSFRLGTATYRATLRTKDEWLDSNAIELVERAAREQGHGSQFYLIDGGEAYLYLTPAQHAGLQQLDADLFVQP
ncbi:hypothetical protein [Hymenobacter metallilatus]|uniref:Uncharacterized protein n=1 Tax=Hymenobacter metallilatus TaxID=2493666 RepID=A0A428JTV1_9BACT|nr:hypothetical protein [Hymenobacter metallilatus]RSK37563.1 hypothetical protein EI290_02640 [Hymenobacter metallilatus]